MEHLNSTVYDKVQGQITAEETPFCFTFFSLAFQSHSFFPFNTGMNYMIIKPLDVCELFFPSVYSTNHYKHFGVLFVKIGPL